jgi:hypothetical protein
VKLKILCFLISLNLPVVCFSQTRQKIKPKHYNSFRGYLSLSGGASFPISDYADKDIYNERAGLATIGNQYQASFAYYFAGFAGVAGKITRQQNFVDATPVKKLWGSANPMFDVEAQSSYYACDGAFGGICFLYYPDKDSLFFFDVRLLAGALNTQSPPMHVSGVSKTAGWVATVDLNSYAALAVAWSIGVSVKINLGKTFFLNFYGDYLTSTPEFKDVSVVYSYKEPYIYTYKQEISVINAGVGLGIKFR